MKIVNVAEWRSWYLKGYVQLVGRKNGLRENIQEDEQFGEEKKNIIPYVLLIY